MKYYLIPQTLDDVDMPTRPDPIELGEISRELIDFLERYRRQGYYSNASGQRLYLDLISFRIEPSDSHGYIGMIERAGKRARTVSGIELRCGEGDADSRGEG